MVLSDRTIKEELDKGKSAADKVAKGNAIDTVQNTVYGLGGTDTTLAAVMDQNFGAIWKAYKDSGAEDFDTWWDEKGKAQFNKALTTSIATNVARTPPGKEEQVTADKTYTKVMSDLGFGANDNLKLRRFSGDLYDFYKADPSAKGISYEAWLTGLGKDFFWKLIGGEPKETGLRGLPFTMGPSSEEPRRAITETWRGEVD